jgi:hypothetical protein
LVLIVLTVPIVIFKNATRIVAISTLAVYVDRIFLDGPFHHQFGGVLFSVVGMVLFILVLGALQKLERRGQPTSRTADSGIAPENELRPPRLGYSLPKRFVKPGLLASARPKLLA